MSRTFRLFFLTLGASIVLFAAAFWMPNRTLAATAAIAALFLGLPASLLLYRDAVRTLARHRADPSNRRFGALALPIRLLGIISVIIGAVIVAWVSYNLLIARQPEFTGVRSLAQLAVPILLIVFGWRWMKNPLASDEDDEAA